MKKTTKPLKNQTIKVGNIVEGQVIKIGRKEVWVDLKGEATGVIRGPELEDELGETKNLKLGENVTAIVIEEENEKGVVELSLRQISHLKVWESLKKNKDDRKTLKVKVIGANKGGLIVSYGKLQGFIPASQLASDHYPQVEDGDKNKILNILKEMIGKSLEVKIIDSGKAEGKIIFSEKEVELEKRKSFLKKYQVGDVVEGKIVGLSPFGAFIEFGDGLKGLIHISELSWQKVENIGEIVKIGETRKAKIISLDNSKISLSLKELVPDPWKDIEKKYKVGQIVSGKVKKITPYGIFVELEKDIQGLVHISEMPAENKNNIEIGKVLKLKIISLEPKDHRLGLSLKL